MTLLCIAGFAGCGKHAESDRVERAIPVEPGARAPAVLAGAQASCDSVVADDRQVFWITLASDERFTTDANAGRIMACSTRGCGPTGPQEIAVGQTHIGAIALDREFVYWTIVGYHGVQSAIMKCARGGCGLAPEYVYRYEAGAGVSGAAPVALAVDSEGIYWADSDGRSIEACTSSRCVDGKPVLLAHGSATPRSLAVTDGTVYWSNDDGTVSKCSARGCGGQATTLASTPGSARQVVVDGGWVHWIADREGSPTEPRQSRILSCPAAGCAGAPRVDFTTDGSIVSLGWHRDRMIWSQRGGALGDGLMTCAGQPCVPALVAPGQPKGLASSAAGIFWSDEASHEIRMLGDLDAPVR